MKKIVFYLLLQCILPFATIWAQSQDTINKCSKDMQSTNAEIRQQAAMILGKYDEPEVTLLLLKHLKDESHLVRRAVLVSLQDRIQKRMVSIKDMAQVILLLEDPDVEVRRLASSTAQFIIGLVLRDNSYHPSERTNIKQFPDDQKKLKAVFLKSIQDSDDIVRLNILTTISQHRYLFIEPEFNTAILTRIDDTNKSAIILALDLIQTMEYVEASAIATKLIDHADADVQVALVKFLAQRRFSNAEIWQKLIAKKNLEVAARAISVAFDLGIKDTETEYSNFILDATNPISLRISLLKQLSRHSKKNELATNLLEDKSNQIRLETIRLCPQILNINNLKILLLKYLDDADANIQNEATNILLVYLTSADIEILKKLFKSDKSQTRLAVLEKLEQLKINDDDIILEAMLDDAKSIRLKSFDLCRSFKSANPQIKSMISRSIDDKDPEIRNAALNAISLYVTDKEMIEIYTRLIQTSDAIVKAQIANNLKKIPLEDSKPLLNILAADKDINVSTQAHLSLYLFGNTASAEILAKSIQAKEIPASERLMIQQILMREKNIVKDAFAYLLSDSSEEIRLNSIKFFNMNRDLYQEEYIKALFTETNSLIIQITTELYIAKKFQNAETITKLLLTDNQRVKTLGFRLLIDNYKEEFLPILQTLFKVTDSRSIYLSLEIIKKHNIQVMDAEIIAKLNATHEKTIRPYYLLALLTLNTDKSKEYIKTIDEKHSHYNDLQVAKQNKADEENRRPKPGVHSK